MIDRLRPHQQAPAQQQLELLRRFSATIDASDTGIGKTYLASWIASQLKLPTLVIGPKISKHAWDRGAKHFDDKFSFCNYELLRTGNTPFGNYDSFREAREYFRCIVCQCNDPQFPCPHHPTGIHCLERKRTSARYGNFQFHPAVKLLIFDECFPAGTRVATPQGYKTVETICAGDLVCTPRGPRRVLRTFINQQKPLIKIKHEHGHFYCTKNHKIATQTGWKMASDLQHLQDAIFFRESGSEIPQPKLHVFKSRLFEKKKRPNAKRNAEAAIKASTGRSKTNDHKQPGSASRESSKNQRATAGETFCWRSRREWTSHSASKIFSKSSWFRMGNRVVHWLARLLTRRNWLVSKCKSGFGESGAQNCGRGGWEKSSESKNQTAGCEEGLHSQIARMGSFPDFERYDCQASRILGVYDSGVVAPVYNLEVEKEHVYFAEGVLVSNCHRCNGLDSLNAELMVAARRQKIKTLALSATPANSPLNMRALGYLLDIHNDKEQEAIKLSGHILPRQGKPSFSQWARRYDCWHDPQWKGLKWWATPEEQKKIMLDIRQSIIPARGIRITTDQVPGFPKRVILPELYTLDAPEAIDGCYREMAAAIEELKLKSAGDKNPDLAVTRILRERQQVELLKVPVATEIGQDDLDKGMSVVWFVNFRQTIDELKKRFPEAGIIDGSPESLRNRQRYIDRFQDNALRQMIVNCKAGGVSLSLHDLLGDHIRSGIVFPGFSAEEFRQLVGRLHRDGGLTTCYYRVIFAAGTVEEPVWKNLSRKLDCMDALIDGDLMPENLKI